MCTCVNIPYQAQQMAEWSINNHGNELFAYYEPNCSKKRFEPTFIPAGYNKQSYKMHMHEKIDPLTETRYKIQSIGPDPKLEYFKRNCGGVNLIKNLELFENAQNSSQQNILYHEMDDKYDQIEFFGSPDFQGETKIRYRIIQAIYKLYARYYL